MGKGVTFADKIHTERDWGLKLLSVYIPMPAPKTQLVDIPGGDGNIDLTEINGRPAYNDRQGLELVFDLMDGDYKIWFMKYSEFAKEVHGKKVKMILDDEPEHYYMVRLELDGEKTNPVYGQIVLSGTAEPFKYDLQSSGEPWKWDTFNFRRDPFPDGYPDYQYEPHRADQRRGNGYCSCLYCERSQQSETYARGTDLHFESRAKPLPGSACRGK